MKRNIDVEATIVGNRLTVILNGKKVHDNIVIDGEVRPCERDGVRDVINHITGGSTMFAVCVEEGSVPDDLLGQLMGGDNLGDDYVGAWEKASSRAVAAFDAPGALRAD